MRPDTAPPFTENTSIKLPVKLWLGVLFFTASAAGGWYSLRADNAVNTAEITQLKADNQNIRQEQREMREILIRVDENVKDLKWAVRRSGAPVPQ